MVSFQWRTTTPTRVPKRGMIGTRDSEGLERQFRRLEAEFPSVVLVRRSRELRRSAQGVSLPLEQRVGARCRLKFGEKGAEVIERIHRQRSLVAEGFGARAPLFGERWR